MKIDGTNQGLSPIREPDEPASSDLKKEDFLKLLTIQLSQQDPLNPMDNQAFVTQLSQMATVEKLENISMSVDNMAMAQAANTSAQVTSFIGQDVTVDSSDVIVEDGAHHEFGYSLNSDASSVEVMVRDEHGEIVKTIEVGARSAGEHAVEWDGTDDNGNPVGDGEYTFEVYPKDAEDNDISHTTYAKRRVNGVTYANGFPELLLEGGGETGLGRVREVSTNNR